MLSDRHDAPTMDGNLYNTDSGEVCNLAKDTVNSTWWAGWMEPSEYALLAEGGEGNVDLFAALR